LFSGGGETFGNIGEKAEAHFACGDETLCLAAGWGDFWKHELGANAECTEFVIWITTGLAIFSQHHSRQVNLLLEEKNEIHCS
jgi:hypothetical protein